jgi:hypothetical protein
VDPLHERVTRVGLVALEQYGFALAGGYAIQAHGIIQRPSEDVDLFTDRGNPVQFRRALDAAVQAWGADGLKVVVDAVFETFARLFLTDEQNRQMKVELGYDWRAKPYSQLAVGPVLHRDDAVASKVCTAFSRGLPRDYIDINAVLTSGRYTKEELLRLAAEHDPGFDTVLFAQALRASRRYDDDMYTAYGLTTEQVNAMRSTLLEWAQELESS